MSLLPIEAMHPGPVPVKKKGKRAAYPDVTRDGRPKKRGTPADDGLTALYAWFTGNGRSLAGAPETLLQGARRRVDARMHELRELRKLLYAKGGRVGRVRAQLVWLRRWHRMLPPARKEAGS